MGQYFILVNLDKREYVHPHRIGGVAKFWEWCVNRQAGILPFLLRKSSEGGGGDIHFESKYAGRWAGNRVVLVGDYDESGLYDKAKQSYKEISRGLVKDYNKFINYPEKELEYSP